MRMTLASSLVFLLETTAFAGAAFAQTDTWRERAAVPAGGGLWGSNITIENRPCCEPTGRASEQEAPVLAALAGRANRVGRTLRLQLGVGRTLRIVDCDNAQACDVENVRVHRLAGRWPALGYYIVAVSGYVDQMAYLVRERDGLIVRTLAPPVLAPDERHAIATDLLIARGPGSTEALDMSVDPPAPLPFLKSATCPALLAPGSLPRWIDNSNALFSDAMLPAGASKPKDLVLRIAGGAAEWVCRY
jgi:hypothetical protein